MRLARCGLALLIAATLSLEWVGAQSGTGRISGRVVDGTSGEPVPGATVAYSPDGNRTRTTVQGDDAGRFTFEGVPAGRLYVSASKTGLAGGYYGQRRSSDPSQLLDLAAGERLPDVELRMWRRASIAGEVRDQEGRPIAGADVNAHTLRVIAGRVGVEAGRTARTDSTGRYTVTDLSPGPYVVSVTFGIAPVSAAGRGGGGGARDQVIDYPRVFYPDALTVSEATAIELGGGEARAAIDVVQRPQYSVPVSGKVAGRSDVPLTVELYRTVDGSEFATGLTALTANVTPDGVFLFPRVTPGQYVVRVVAFPKLQFADDTLAVYQMASYSTGGSVAYGGDTDRGLPLSTISAPTMWAELPIVVATEPVRDLALTLQEAGRIRGVIAFDGSSVKPSPESLLQTVVAVFDLLGRNLGRFPAARIEGDGAFSIAGLPPGNYSLMFLPVRARGDRSATWVDHWRSQEMLVDGKRSPAAVIELGATDVPVTLTLTDKLATLQGVVRDASGRQRPDASILVVQADRKLWTIGAAPKLFRPDRHGGYDTELASGDYLVSAHLNLPALWAETSALEQLVRSAVRVRIERGQRHWQDLTADQR